ncbi:hypothetical protein BGZ93_009928, partial [Podila epicladia]
ISQRKVVRTTLFLALGASFVTADCCTDLKTCRINSINLQPDVDQYQKEKGSFERENYCWNCAYKGTKRFIDAADTSSFQKCFNNAACIRDECIVVPDYKCGSKVTRCRGYSGRLLPQISD